MWGLLSNKDTLLFVGNSFGLISQTNVFSCSGPRLHFLVVMKLPASCPLSARLSQFIKVMVANLQFAARKTKINNVWLMKRDNLHLSAFSHNLHLKNRCWADWLIALCLCISEAQVNAKCSALGRDWRVTFDSMILKITGEPVKLQVKV